MKRFTYKGRSSDGRIVSDHIVCETKLEARKKLSDRGVVVLEIDEIRRSLLSSTHVPLKLKISFFDQLYYIVRGGNNVHKGLKMISEQTKHVYFKEVIDTLIYYVESGTELSYAMEKFPKIFDNSVVFLIRSAEYGGFLEESLRRISYVLERKADIRSKVRGALMYPFIVVGLIMGVMYFMLAFFIPSMQELLEDVGAETPLVTDLLLMFSEFFVNNSTIILGVVVATVCVVVILFKKVDRVQRTLDKYVFKMPLFGGMVNRSLLVEFSMTLSSLLSGGVQLSKAVDNLIKSTNNSFVRDQLNVLSKKLVDEGSSLQESMSGLPFFPPQYIQMVGVGEESGDLPESLESLTEKLTKELDSMIKVSVELINPILIAVLAGVILVMVFALFLPILSVMDGV